MSRYKHLLVATDFSEPASRATKAAALLAVQFKAKVSLLHVVQTPPPPIMVEFVPFETARGDRDAGLLKSAREGLADVRHRDFPTLIDVRMLDKMGDHPAKTICSTAEEIGADLIVVGTHGHTGLKHLLLGSVAEKVVRHASCSVLTINPDCNAVDVACQRILVATDLSRDNSPALDAATDWARDVGASLTLMHVIHPGAPAWVGPPGSPIAQDSQIHQEQMLEVADTQLKSLAKSAQRAGVATDTEAVADTRTAEAICRQALECDADMVAISTMGRTGLSHLVLGSIAESIVRRCPKPVLVAR